MPRIARIALAVTVSLLAACGDASAPAAPAVASVTITATKDTLTSLGETSQLSAVLKDASGNVISGRTVVWSSNAAVVASVNATTGLATAVGNGLANISATVDGITGSRTLAVAQLVATVTVTPGTPMLTSVGATQQFSAAPKDANGNPVAGAPLLWISTNQAVATVDTLGFATARGPGVATITAAAQGVPGHAVLSVTQSATQLAFRVGPPVSTIAGEPFATAVQVEVRDAGGSVVRDAQVPITLTASAGTLKGSTTVNAINGVASFSGLYVETTGTTLTLTAGAAPLTAAVSSAFAITHATPAAVVYVQPPGSDSAGAQLGVIARIRDRFGNTATSVTDSVRLRFFANPAAGTLSGDTVVAAVAGVATFTGPRITKSGLGYRLRVTAPAVDSALSLAFEIKPASAHHLSGTTEHSTTLGNPNPAGLLFTVRDQFENLVTDGTHSVTVSLDSVPFAPAQLSGTLTRLTVGGNVTFTELEFSRPTGSAFHYVVLASASGLAVHRAHVNAGLVFSTPMLGAGAMHTCRIVNLPAPHSLNCWGANGSGQLGNSAITAPADSAPVISAASLAAAAVSGGDAHTCVRDFGNTVHCFGANDQGQLGRAGAGGSTPGPVSGGLTFWRVASGGFHNCGLSTADSTAYCWGDNSVGQLGNADDPNDQSTPVAVSGGRKFFTIAMGRFHSCGLQKADSLAFCWGLGTSGQLGNNGIVSSDVPVAVTGGTQYIWLALGDTHSCAIADITESNVHCWGANNLGQLGNDAPNAKLVPTLIPSFSLTFFQPQMHFASGSFHTCGRAPGGNASIYCWGANGDGQIGPNAGATAPSPVISFDGAQRSADRFVAGRLHSCAFASGASSGFQPGTFCWGRNVEGQLGTGSTVGGTTIRRIIQ